MKDFLKGISKENKKEFLSKLQSGKYTLLPAYTPAPELNFDLIPESGLYKCQETGQELTSQELATLPGYRLDIELVSDRLQVAGEKLPDGVIKVPFSESEYLDSLLKNKSDQLLTFDESSGKFKTESDSYSFDQLMQTKHDNPELNFVMDQKTATKYAEFLENWC